MRQPERNPRKAVRQLNLIGLAVTTVFFGGVGGWAATSQLAGAVIAGGAIVVESNVKKVQHPSGGIVGEILVKEGDVVEADQALVRLDDTLTRATLGIVQSQLDQFMAREVRLNAERDGSDITFAEALLKRRDEPTVAGAIAG